MEMVNTTSSFYPEDPWETVGNVSAAGQRSAAFVNIILTTVVTDQVVKQYASLWAALLASFIISQNVRKCPKVISETLQVFLINATLLPCLPIALAIPCSMIIVRWIIDTFLKVVHSGKYLLMHPTDVAWALELPAITNHFTALYILKGDLGLESLQTCISKRMVDYQEGGTLVYEKLRYVAFRRFGFYFWRKSEDVHIGDHVKYMDAEAAEAREVCTEEGAFRHLQAITDTPMKSDKPQWEVLLIPRFEYVQDAGSTSSRKDKYCAVIFRIHHSIMDGVSAGNCLRFALADTPPKLYVDPCERLRLNWFQKAFLYGKTVLLGPSQVASGMVFREENCFHHQNMTGPKSFSWSRPITIEGLKVIKDKYQATTTSVLMSAVAGAIRNVAIKKKLPVPAQVQAAPTIAIFPYPDSRPQNKFVLVHFPLETGLRTSVERLKAAHAKGKELATSIFPLACFWLIRLAGLMPAIVPDTIINNLHATLVLSNVPGPSETARLFGGHELVDVVFWLPLKSKTGIGACFFSYAGRVHAAFVSDKSAFPDAEDVRMFAEEFDSEIVSLARLAGLEEEAIFWQRT